MLDVFAVAVGGGIGSCVRFGFSKLFARWYALFPFGTLLSNVVAGVAIGFIIGMEQQTAPLPPRTKLFLTVGLLGGLSTFSTFSMETIQLLQGARYIPALGNIALNLGLSLLGVVLGLSVARLLVKRA